MELRRPLRSSFFMGPAIQAGIKVGAVAARGARMYSPVAIATAKKAAQSGNRFLTGSYQYFKGNLRQIKKGGKLVNLPRK